MERYPARIKFRVMDNERLAQLFSDQLDTLAESLSQVSLAQTALRRAEYYSAADALEGGRVRIKEHVDFVTKSLHQARTGHQFLAIVGHPALDD